MKTEEGKIRLENTNRIHVKDNDGKKMDTASNKGDAIKVSHRNLEMREKRLSSKPKSPKRDLARPQTYDTFTEIC